MMRLFFIGVWFIVSSMGIFAQAGARMKRPNGKEIEIISKPEFGTYYDGVFKQFGVVFRTASQQENNYFFQFELGYKQHRLGDANMDFSEVNNYFSEKDYDDSGLGKSKVLSGRRLPLYGGFYPIYSVPLNAMFVWTNNKKSRFSIQTGIGATLCLNSGKRLKRKTAIVDVLVDNIGAHYKVYRKKETVTIINNTSVMPGLVIMLGGQVKIKKTWHLGLQLSAGTNLLIGNVARSSINYMGLNDEYGRIIIMATHLL